MKETLKTFEVNTESAPRFQNADIFRHLVSAVEDYAIYALDSHGHIMTWNAGAYRLKGYKTQEVLSRHFSVFYTAEDRVRNHSEQVLELARLNGKYVEEGWRVKKDGTRFWASIALTALKDDEGKLCGFAKVTRDLTERIKAEERRVLDQVFSESPSFMSLISVPDYRYLKTNAQHFKLFGKSNIIGKKIIEVPSGLEEQGVLALLDQVVKTGRAYTGKEVEIVIAGEDGMSPRKVYLDYVYQPLKRVTGEVYAITIQGYDVTEKVRSRQTVENERENFLNLFRQTPELVCILKGPNHVFEFVNEAHVQVLGFDATGMTVKEAQPDSVEVLEPLDKVYRTGKTEFMHEIPITLAGRLRHFNLTFTARRDESGRINGIMILGIEVTNEVHGREVLKFSQERLNKVLRETKNLLNVTPSFIGLVEPHSGKVITCNDRALEVMDQTREEVFGKEFWSCACWSGLPNSSAQVRESVLKASRGIPSEFDIQYRIASGDIRWINVHVIPYLDNSGKVEQIAFSGMDITERKFTEDQLRHSELRYRTLTEAIPQLVWGCSSDGLNDYVNDTFIHYTGLEEKDLMGLGWLDIVFPIDRERISQQWANAVKGLAPYEVEMRLRRYDGVYHWFKVRGKPMRNHEGKVVYWVGTCTDIEEERRNLAVLKTLNEVGGYISAELDLNKLVQWVTEASTKLAGAEFGAFFINNNTESNEPSTLSALYGISRDEFSRLRPGHLIKSILEVPVISRSGEVLGELYFGHSRKGAFSKNEKEIIKGMASQTAIAIDNAKLYQQIKEAVRLRDDFLSIASHELRTPLTGMKIQTQMFKRNKLSNSAGAFHPDRVERLMGFIDRGLDRLVRLVDDMLDISRIQNGKLTFNFEYVDIGTLVIETLERLSSELSNVGIDVRYDLPSEQVCYLDKFRMEQVFTNLISNVIRYAPRAPLDVSLKNENDSLILSFEDHGPGIQCADRDKVFNRFERLVSANDISGMGLGLFICKEIIEGHTGSIHIESGEGQGARFVIKLPVLERKDSE